LTMICAWIAIGPVGFGAVPTFWPPEADPAPRLPCPLPCPLRPPLPDRLATPVERFEAGAPPGRLAGRAGALDLAGAEVAEVVARVREAPARVPPPPFGPPAGREVVPVRSAGVPDADRSTLGDPLAVVREVESGTWASFGPCGTPRHNSVGWYLLAKIPAQRGTVFYTKSGDWTLAR
jgi:hypothetical protein